MKGYVWDIDTFVAFLLLFVAICWRLLGCLEVCCVWDAYMAAVLHHDGRLS